MFRFGTINIEEEIMKQVPRVIWLVFLVMFLLTLSQVAAFSKEDGNPNGGVLNYGEYGRPATLDPITSNDMISLRVSELLFSGLVGIDEKQEIVPRNILINFLTKKLPSNELDVVLLKALSGGLKDGKKVCLDYTLIDYYDKKN